MMKVIDLFATLLLLTKAYSMESDSLNEPMARKVNEIDFIERGVYQKKAADDLYLVMERPSLNLKKFDGWKKFAKAIVSELESRYGENTLYAGTRSKELDFYRDTYENFELFKSILSYSFKKSYDSSKELQVWVAQALNTDYLKLKKKFDTSIEAEKNDWFKHVEMTMCVIFYTTDPFQTHISITRNIFYEGIKHSQLSLRLHGFAAEITRFHHPEKLYMITKPLYSMRSIFTENLPKNSFQEEADQLDGWCQEITKPKGTYSWIVRSPNKQTLLEINGQIKRHYNWLLDEGWDVDFFSVDLKALADLKLL